MHCAAQRYNESLIHLILIYSTGIQMIGDWIMEAQHKDQTDIQVVGDSLITQELEEPDGQQHPRSYIL